MTDWPLGLLNPTALMKRNRQLTEKRIVDAAKSLLAEEGFQAFGVNAVAARAGVDKVLIYRYFDGLEGLLKFIGETEVLYPTAGAMLDTDLAGFFKNYQKALSENALGNALHRWERVADNPLTRAYRRQRQVFWDDASRLLRPQSDPARSLIELLAATPIELVSAESLRPLLSSGEFDPVQGPNRPVEVDETERLSDNLL